MTLIGMVYLMLDSIGNTFLFSFDPQSRSTITCDLGVIITVTCQFGFLSMIFMRMYRINSVFSAYEAYLKFSKQQVMAEK